MYNIGTNALLSMPPRPSKVQRRPSQVQPRLSQVQPRPPRTVSQMPTSPNARARESNSRPYPASPSSAATRRSTRPRQAPSLPSTPVVLDERVYKVPLPRDTDLGWKLQALVDDKSGLSLVPGGPLQDVVDQRVHLASYGLEHYFPEGFIYMQRAYVSFAFPFSLIAVYLILTPAQFAAEIQPPPFPSRPFRRKEGGITLGYVLENLVNQQLKAWRSSVRTVAALSQRIYPSMH